MIKPNETVSIGWCDNGITDGKFTEGLVSIILAGANNGIPIAGSIRVPADKDTHPMVSGIYFIAKDRDGSLPVPMPVIFDDIDEYRVKYHHPLPPNQVLKIDMAGMGLVVMHRDVVTKLREKFGNDVSFFAENDQKNDKFVGEDISFFRKCKTAGIPLHAHTGAVAKHMKTTVWDMDLYALYWNSKAQQK